MSTMLPPLSIGGKLASAAADTSRTYPQLFLGPPCCRSDHSCPLSSFFRSQQASRTLLQGVYHRDLRLDALRLDACDDLVLTDFGYSAAKLTASGEMADLRNPAASPAYTPPEVLLGHSIVNAKYDGEVLGERLWTAEATHSLQEACPLTLTLAGGGGRGGGCSRLGMCATGAYPSSCCKILLGTVS